MKSLDNKQTDIQPNESRLTYGDLIKSCLDNPPDGGFTRDDIRKRDRIETAVDNGKKEIELEDADADNLKQIVSQMTWGIRHKDLIDFHDAIENL